MLGAGNRASTVLREFARNGDACFVAVCDPFRDRREQAKATLEELQNGSGVAAYNDFRDVMSRRDVDAVVCCSCDHWHVPLALAAARAGKDMYVEKPLSVSVAWSKVLREAVRRSGRVFQYGTQQRSQSQFRHAVEVVRNGSLGEIRHVDAWCIDGTRATEWFDPRTVVEEPVPEGLDYELWLGPAQKKPYSRFRVHREGSFHTYDYSLGFIAGWGAHPLDIAQWGLDADTTGPIRVEGTGKLPTTGGLFSTVYDWDLLSTYASGVTMRFLSHRPAEPVIRKYRRRWSDHGTTFFGAGGWISVDRGGLEASDPKLLELRRAQGDERLAGGPAHDRNFLDCVRSRKETVSPLEAAIRSDTISHLCDIAVRTGRPIRWDPAAERILADESAERLLAREPRAPWTI